MTLKDLEKQFNKNKHPDLKNILEVSFLPIHNNKIEVCFLDDFFETFETFNNEMYLTMEKYYSEPDKYYKLFCGSNNINENIIAVIDKRTGQRSLNNWRHIKDNKFIKFLELRTERV